NIPAYEVDVVMYQPYQLSVGAWNNSNFWIEKMQESGERIRLEKYGFLQGEYSIDCYGIYAKGLEAFSSARSVVDRAIEETNPPEQITATSEEELGRKLSEINKTFIEKAKTGLHKLSETGVDYDISVDVQKINLLWTEKSHEVFQGGVKSELEFIPDVKVRFDITNTRDDQTFPVYDGERVVMSPLTLVFVFSYSPEELMKEAAVLEYNTKLLAFVSYDSNGNVIDTEPCYEKSYCEMLFYAMVQEEPDIKTDAGYVPVSLVKPEIPVPGTDNLRRIVSANAMRNSLQRDMVFALVHKESGWNPNLVSPSGAVGLMQLLPSTAEGYGWDKTRESLFDPDVNSRCGTNYLRFLIDKFGDERIALAAYNYGYGNLKRLVNRYGSDYSKIRKRLPIETRQLVDYVMTFRKDYAAYLKQTEAVV
ncbi:MAG: lytic transglycosylase domain-containing protein, partial [Candidatus Aenigmatarchaeota archaeon]